MSAQQVEEHGGAMSRRFWVVYGVIASALAVGSVWVLVALWSGALQPWGISFGWGGPAERVATAGASLLVASLWGLLLAGPTKGESVAPAAGAVLLGTFFLVPACIVQLVGQGLVRVGAW